jgi:hypothetical protein
MAGLVAAGVVYSRALGHQSGAIDSWVHSSSSSSSSQTARPPLVPLTH